MVFCTCVLCCDSLREAQAVLLKKGLSRGGNGDKMAALLMKHVEKEKKKVLPTTVFPPASNSSLSPAPSPSLQAHVRTFHTQKGQYTVHFMPPGQFFCTTRMQQKVLHKNRFLLVLKKTPRNTANSINSLFHWQRSLKSLSAVAIFAVFMCKGKLQPP